MTIFNDRRRVLQGSLAAVASLSLAPAVFAKATTATQRPLTTRLTDRLAVIGGVGANVVVLTGADGLLLVDSGAAEHAAALRGQLQQLAGTLPVRTLINTHWHAQQTGSNEAFGKAGAQVIAQAKTAQRLSTDQYQPAQDRYVKALPKPAQPGRRFHLQDRLDVAGETLELGYLLEAHTDGDCFVHFRSANVIAVGDAASPERDPILDWYGGGWLGGRIDGLSQLIARGNEATRYVPAQGPVVGRAELQAEQAMLETVFARMTEFVRKGYSAQDILAAGVLNGLPRTLNDPQTFVESVFKGFWAHHNTLSPDVV